MCHWVASAQARPELAFEQAGSWPTCPPSPTRPSRPLSGLGADPRQRQPIIPPSRRRRRADLDRTTPGSIRPGPPDRRRRPVLHAAMLAGRDRRDKAKVIGSRRRRSPMRGRGRGRQDPAEAAGNNSCQPALQAGQGGHHHPPDVACIRDRQAVTGGGVGRLEEDGTPAGRAAPTRRPPRRRRPTTSTRCPPPCSRPGVTRGPGGADAR